MKRLRGERGSFAVLGLLLLLVQLLLSGLSQGAMAGERLATVGLVSICQTIQGENRVLAGSPDHQLDRQCPCLAGLCTVNLAVHLDEARDRTAVVGAAPRRAVPFAVPSEGPDRRPLALFARGGRGPPAIG